MGIGRKHRQHSLDNNLIFSWYQNPQDYPVHKIKNILKNQTLPIPGFFDKSGEDDREELPSYIGTRFLSDNGDKAMEFTNICYENTQYIYPKQGTTKKGIICMLKLIPRQNLLLPL